MRGTPGVRPVWARAASVRAGSVRAVLRTGAVTGSLVATVLSAQRSPATPRVDSLGLDTPAFREATSLPWWQYLAQQPCIGSGGGATPSGSAPGGDAALDTLLWRRVGALPRTPAGQRLQGTPVGDGRAYRVSLETVTGRHAGTEVLGWLLEPNTRSATPRVALVLHGAGATFEAALGWRLPGGNPDGFARTPLDGVAAELVLRGWTVFVPLVSDDLSFWPLLPWLDLENHAAAWRARGGPASAYALVLPQLQGAVDFAVRQVSDSTAPVVVVGWEEGAALGRMLAAVDTRVAGVLTLGPIVDRAAYRQQVAGVQTNAPFTHADCRFDDVTVARRLAARALAHVVSGEDPLAPRRAAFVSPRIAQAAKEAYRAAGGDSTRWFEAADAPGDTTRPALARALQFLARAVGDRTDDGRPLVRSADWMPQPAALQYPTAQAVAMRRTMSRFVASQRACAVPRDVLAMSRGDVLLQASRAQRHLATMLGSAARRGAAWAGADAAPGPRRTDAAVQLVRRDTLAVRQNTVVEWIVANASRSPLPLVGLLGAPPDVAARSAAGVLSFDGNYGLSQLFGLPPQGVTSYLGEYGRVLARDGDVVFAPLVPDWVPRGATALLRGRGADDASAWPLLLEHYAAGVDLLRALPAVDRARIGAYGISYAGYAALLATATDARIGGLVFSNPAAVLPLYFQTEVGSSSGVWLSELCAVSDDALRYLIAPRGLVFETDGSDTGTNQRYDGQQVAELRHIFDALGVAARFTAVRHDGGHETRVYPLVPYLPWR